MKFSIVHPLYPIAFPECGAIIGGIELFINHELQYEKVNHGTFYVCGTWLGWVRANRVTLSA
jgi:hypothetical protein